MMFTNSNSCHIDIFLSLGDTSFYCKRKNNTNFHVPFVILRRNLQTEFFNIYVMFELPK